MVIHMSDCRGSRVPTPMPASIAVLAACVMLAMLCALRADAQETDVPVNFWQQATIYRDEWGIPHIQADSLEAMAFAFGYAQAEDHIEPMLHAYRVANGRAAEVFGPDYADSDEFSLKMAHAALAEQAYAVAGDATRALCAGFAQGVNTWLMDHPGEAPSWSDGVRPEDILALLHAYLMSFAPMDVPGLFSRDPASLTGNAWAIGASRSATGEPILVVNPHVDYRGPFQWCEAHLTVGDYNVLGATLFGLPIILQGHNGVLGWALTPNAPDFADVYVRTTQTQQTDQNPADLSGSGGSDETELELLRTLQLLVQTKSYRVLTPGGLEERQVSCLDTENGPYIGDINGRACLWQIGGYRDFGALAQLLDMGRSSDLTSFQAAWGQQQLPCFHLVYADRQGNLFYHYNAKVGDKYWPPAILDAGVDASSLKPVDWTRPVPANNPLFKWGPYASPDELPMVTNPPSGFLQACATTPWSVTDQTSLDPKDWPAWLVHDEDSMRANRVRRLLTLGMRSYEDMQAMLYDVLVPSAVLAVPKLIAAADGSGEWSAQTLPDLAPGLDALRNWNYVADADSKGMTFFHLYWTTLKSMAPATLSEGALLAALAEDNPEAQTLSLKAAEQTARTMRAEFGSLAIPWGDAHRFYRGNQSVPAAGAGSGDAVFIASAAAYADKIWRVNYGYAYAMAVKFGVTVDTVSVVPFGSSENPDSPHYADQMDLVRDRRMKVVRFDPEEVRRNAKRAYGCSVRFDPLGLPASGIIHSGNPVSVSSSMYTQPAAPLPLGLATFTVYTRVATEPSDAPITLDMNIYIPPELCTDAHLPSLVAYAYDDESGWTRLDSQEIDSQTRIIRFRDRRARTYAILGPAEYRAAQDSDIRSRVALSIPDSAIRERIPKLSSLKSSDAPPPLVPGAPGYREALQRRAQTPQPEPAVQSPQDESGPGQPPVAATPPSAGEMAQDTPLPDPQPPAADAAKPGTRQGAIAWGNTVQLRPPGVDGIVKVSADKAIGARLTVSVNTPRPFSEDLAAFTEFVQVECSSKDTPVKVFVSLRPAPGACDSQNLDKLALYAFDETGGWSKLPGQSYDPNLRGFSAEDSQPRCYALLGPATLRLQP